MYIICVNEMAEKITLRLFTKKTALIPA